MRRSLATLATAGLGLALVLGASATASAHPQELAPVTAQQCITGGGRVLQGRCVGGTQAEYQVSQVTVQQCTDDGGSVNSAAPGLCQGGKDAGAYLSPVTKQQCEAAGGTVATDTGGPGLPPGSILGVCEDGKDDGVPIERFCR